MSVRFSLLESALSAVLLLIFLVNNLFINDNHKNVQAVTLHTRAFKKGKGTNVMSSAAWKAATKVTEK